jgi:hypothetical protein
MKRLLLAAVLVAALAVPSLAGARVARITESFAPTGTGAVVVNGSTTRLLLDVKHALSGSGAASLTLTPTTGGSIAKGVLYDGQGSLSLRLVLRFAPATAGGPSVISGTGKVLTGTNIHAHARGSLKVAGTLSATGVYVLKLKGRVTHDNIPPLVGSGRGQ